jgi:hypothetical protein
MIGLPLIALTEILAEEGIDPLASNAAEEGPHRSFLP